MKRFLCFIILIITLFFLYSRYIAPYNFDVNEYNVINNSLPDSFNGYKIIQFSDILYGETINEEDLKNIVAKINSYNPDIVVFTGDLTTQEYNLNEDNQKIVINYLNQIKANITKLAIYGDYDLVNKNQYLEIMDNSGFIILDNSSKLIFNNNIYPIEITGFTDTQKINESFINENSITPIFKIGLIHKPDDISYLTNTDLNLVLSGHSLGGLMVYPFIGSVINKEGANTYSSGYYKVNNIDLYVSNGLGSESYKLRAFNKPSFNVYRLQNK